MQKLSFSMTYRASTPESIEYGDCEDAGFVFEDEHYTFSELVHLIKKECLYHWSNGYGGGWLSCEPYTIDYKNGEDKELSLHADNERSLRYMRKAYNYVAYKELIIDGKG